MQKTGETTRVAILGGGIGALATAFELSSQPGYEVTIYTLGWRLGGKCASSRGPDNRIEEHGIHGFLGSYYNAIPMLAQVYAELGRAPGTPLATISEALIGLDTAQMYTFKGDTPTAFPFTFPVNRVYPDPTTPHGIISVEDLIRRALAFLEGLHSATPRHKHGGFLVDAFDALAAKVEHLAVAEGEALAQVLSPIFDKVYFDLRALVQPLVEDDPEAYEIFTIVDWFVTLFRGVLADEIAAKGFDYLDNENWTDWLIRNGADPLTVHSPIALNTINLSYQYPAGDTSGPSDMAAGAYVHWSLRSLAFCGHAIYAFAAGTGEAVIAPFYEVLAKRGVKFEFFQKVTALNLSDDKTQIASVDIDVQATLKPGIEHYSPLMAQPPMGLPSWPHEPNYDQLVEGEAMRNAQVDLESWWTPWQPVGSRSLVAGRDFDQLVFAISIGAAPYICPQLIAHSPAWKNMVAALPAVQTMAFQIWLSETMKELGWSIPLTPPNTALGDTYFRPFTGHCEMHHLLRWETWPKDSQPRSLWYFCDEMPEVENPPPPFTDHDYPARMAAYVARQSVDYLDFAIGPLMPGAVNNAGKGDGPAGALDYCLLVDTRPDPGIGKDRFASQFWRANIDPSERYVPSHKGSTAYRLAAWESGYANLTLAGDWTYTGLNVGSVECTVMSGRLASYALTGSPPLDQITGYPPTSRTPPARVALSNAH